jgi:hypothetical protein
LCGTQLITEKFPIREECKTYLITKKQFKLSEFKEPIFLELEYLGASFKKKTLGGVSVGWMTVT